MGMPKEEKRRGDGTTKRSIGEGKGTQWSKGNSNVYGGVDNIQRSGNLCRVQGMQLQENKNSGE